MSSLPDNSGSDRFRNDDRDGLMSPRPSDSREGQCLDELLDHYSNLLDLWNRALVNKIYIKKGNVDGTKLLRPASSTGQNELQMGEDTGAEFCRGQLAEKKYHPKGLTVSMEAIALNIFLDTHSHDADGEALKQLALLTVNDLQYSTC